MERFISALKQKRRAVIFLSILVVAAYFYMQHVFLNQMFRLQQVIHQLDIQNETTARFFSLQEEISRLEAEVSAYDFEIAAMKASLLPYLDIPGLTVGLYRLVQEHNLTGDYLIFDSLIKEENFSYCTMELAVIGASENVYNFLVELERPPLSFGFVDLLLKTAGENTLEARLLLEVYVLPQPESEPTPYKFFPGEYGYPHPFDMFGLVREADREDF